MPLGDGYCSLTEEQTRRSLDEETRTWHIDETMLDELNDDLQTIVQCTEDGDVLQIRASRTVRPTARVVIHWSLTIGAEPEEVDLRDGVLPKEPKRIVLSCPDDNQGIFLVRCVRPNAPDIASSGCRLQRSTGALRRHSDRDVYTAFGREAQVHHRGRGVSEGVRGADRGAASRQLLEESLGRLDSHRDTPTVLFRDRDDGRRFQRQPLQWRLRRCALRGEPTAGRPPPRQPTDGFGQAPARPALVSAGISDRR